MISNVEREYRAMPFPDILADMYNTILFIDGENFIFKLEQVLKRKKINLKEFDLSSARFDNLFAKVLQGLHIEKKVFYIAKLHVHKDDTEKSNELIEVQKKLSDTLTKQGFEIMVAGNVRAQTVRVKKETKIVFREKGVDVQIAVDLVSIAADKGMQTAVLCSSDSDLQPAVKEVKKRGVEMIYLGFQMQPNKGLSYTSDRSILIKNEDILEACGCR